MWRVSGFRKLPKKVSSPCSASAENGEGEPAGAEGMPDVAVALAGGSGA